MTGMRVSGKHLQSLVNHSFIRHSLLMVLGNVGVSLINYFFNLLMARTLSLGSYGEYMTAISYVTVLTIPFGALGSVIIKKIGQSSVTERLSVVHSLEAFLKHTLRQHALLIIFTACLGGFLVSWWGNVQPFTAVFVMVSTVLSLLQIFYMSSLQGARWLLMYNGFNLVANLLKLVLGFGIMKIVPQANAVFILFIVIALIQIITGHLLIRKKSPVATEKYQLPLLSVFKRKYVYMPLVLSIGLIGLANIDLILVKKFLEPELAGLYGAISLLAKIIFYLVSPLISLAYIYFTGEESKAQRKMIFILLLSGILMLGAVMSSGYYLLSDMLIELVFGQRFLPVSHLLWLVAVFGTTYSVMALFCQYWMAQSSSIGWLAVVTVLLQILGISLYHNSIAEVLWVNVVVITALNVVFLVWWIRHEYNGSVRHS